MTRNGNALKSVQQSFEAGFRACLRGASILSCAYKAPIHITAFERGYQRATALKAKENKK